MRLFKKFKSVVSHTAVASLLSVGLMSHASATVSGYAGVSFSSNNIGTEITFDDASTIGWSFTLNSNRTLSSLGLYNTSFDVPTTVSLWNSSGTLISSVLFDISNVTNWNLDDLAASNFIWQSVNSVSLTAGSYTIGAFSNGKHYAVLDATPSATSGLQITAGLINFDSTNARPNDDLFGIAPNGFIGPNLRFAEPVPVPGAVWLLGSGLVGLFGLKRVKKAA